MQQQFEGGRFEILGELGEGREARVFRAVDHQTQTPVALKLLRKMPENVVTLEGAQLLSARHRHLVEVHHVNIENGQAYIIEELMEGGTLDQLPKPLDADMAATLVEQLLSALGFLHALGILHGDIKPENIFFDRRDNPIFKLGDFGLARRRVDIVSGVTQGTPAFMPPEVIRGEIDDERSDLYSFGVTLYECVFGVPPFQCKHVQELLQKHLTATPEHLIQPGRADVRQVDLLRRLLEKDPLLRPASAQAALSRWHGGKGKAPTSVAPTWGALLGRDAELKILDEVFEATNGAVIVHGLGGIGKTRLLEEFSVRRRLQGTRVMFLSPAHLELHSGLLDSLKHSGFMQNNAEELAERLLLSLGTDTWILIVEDLHAQSQLAQQTIMSVLRVVQSRENSNCLVLISSRDLLQTEMLQALKSVGLAVPNSLQLLPWDAHLTQSAAGALFGVQDLDADLVEFLFKASGGLPGELHSICKALVVGEHLRLGSNGELHLLDEVQVAHLPTDWLKATIQDLTAPEKTILNVLCLSRRPMSPESLSDYVSDPISKILRVLQKEGLVKTQLHESATRCRPYHEGVRRAIVQQLDGLERSELHDRMAARVESEEAVYHTANGSNWQQAVDAALDLNSTGRVEVHHLVTLFESLLRLWPAGVDLEGKAHFEVARIDLLMFLGQNEEAGLHIEQALSWAPSGEYRQQLRNRWARLLSSGGQHDEAALHLENPEGGQASLEAEFLSAEHLHNAGRSKEAIQICNRLSDTVEPGSGFEERLLIFKLDLLRQLNGFDQITAIALDQLKRPALRRSSTLEGYLHFYLASAAVHLGRMKEAAAEAQLAYEAFARRQFSEGMLRALSLQAVSAAELAMFTEAENLFRRAIELCRRCGRNSTLYYTAGSLGQMLFVQGRWSEALAQVDEALHLIESDTAMLAKQRNLIIRFGLYARLAVVDKAIDDWDALNGMDLPRVHRGQALLVRAELHLNSMQHAEALPLLDEAEEMLRQDRVQDEVARGQVLRARCYYVDGKIDAALSQLDKAAHKAASLKIPDLVVETEVCRAEFLMAQSSAEVGERVARVLQVARRLELRESLWRLERVLGSIARVQGGRTEAIGHYRRAIQIMREMVHGLPISIQRNYLGTPLASAALVEMKNLS